MPTQAFHPAVQAWFNKSFDAATDVQSQSWASINQGQHTLLAAPTGSGKTLAAFLSAIDSLIKEGLQGILSDETRVLYISPLKALSNDIQINLQQPIQGVRDELLGLGLHDVELNAWVRTGDTPQSERVKASKTPPHILVTTPESIYILLTSESGRKLLKTVETVIVDEIHAVAGSKRGSHLSLSLERLEALIKKTNPKKTLQRIGLSATQNPIETMANFLLGNKEEECTIIDTGHSRKRDLQLVIPHSPLDAVMSNEIWEEIYEKLEQYAYKHNSMLVFVNTRRLAERAARFIAERIGEENVMAHHGSMSKEKRLEAEKRLKAGELKCLVATASLELGIDIGDIDLVCQLGSPRSIAAFLQRVGRSGHSIGATPKGRMFPLSRDELVETTALLKAANDDELDRVIIPEQPLDVLCQQIVAEVSADEWDVDELYQTFVRAWPYRNLEQAEFDKIIKMLADGFSTRRGRRAAYLHYDAVNRRVRTRKGSRIIALTNAGAIPDQFDCEVILQPEGFRIGTVGEDFAFESMPGDIFQLGNASYRILKSETGKVFVEDAKGQPPNIPFWLGEAPGRTDELSLAVSNLRQAANQQLENGITATQNWLMQEYQITQGAAEQLCAYLATSQAALGILPNQNHIVFERFFDEVGDMHFVIHSSYGSRINKAWGLALRKRFCRKFNFELQAAALEDSIVLSLSSTHSFQMEEVARYLNPKTVREVLIQAMLDAPMFPTRWRWNATIALAVLRNRFGKRSPPYFQRSDAEDLIAILFPDQIACGENIQGDREIPDHPLVTQAVNDCLHQTMDINGLIQILEKIQSKDIKITCCDLVSPSPLSQEVISAKPYAFLDDGAAEERRTMAIKTQRHMSVNDASELSKLDPAAIQKVREEAWPLVRTADELHDGLMLLGFMVPDEVNEGPNKGLDEELNKTEKGQEIDLLADQVDSVGWQHLHDELVSTSRATCITPENGKPLWIAAERLHEFKQLFPDAETKPEIPAIYQDDKETPDGDVLLEIIRSRLEGLGPVTALQLAQPLGLDVARINQVLLSLQQEGFVVQGRFSNQENSNKEIGKEEWCERRLLARIHRYTISRLRSEIEPVSLSNYMRFLFDWQGIGQNEDEKGEGMEALAFRLQQLEGYSVAARAWESEILPARIKMYTADLLENLCVSGRFSWMRLNVVLSADKDKKKKSPVSLSPITLIQRQNIPYWQQLASPSSSATKNETNEQTLSPYAEKIKQTLESRGALFFNDIVMQTGILKTQVEEALGELVNWGLVTSDGFNGLRALIMPQNKRKRSTLRRARSMGLSPFDNAGRWSLVHSTSELDDIDSVEFIAHTLLKRYGVVFRQVLQRETNLPPWRDLLRVYWRMEARGEIRGGRFVNGVSGEQFATMDALSSLRKTRNKDKTGNVITLSSYDPLNLVGILLPGEKVPVSQQTKIVFQDGVAIAVENKQKIEYLCDVTEETRWQTSVELNKKVPGFVSGRNPHSSV